MEQENRQGESGPLPLRSDRYFCLANEWYFVTREKQIHGPFESREEACEALAHFLNTVAASAE